MPPLSFYTRKNEPWTEDEVENLQYEYESGFSVTEIADLHKRTPGVVAYKLKSLGLVKTVTAVRGYKEYKKSDLYTEIVENSKSPDLVKEVRALAKEIRLMREDLDKLLSSD